MFELLVKNKDGSTYVKEVFETQEQMDKWLQSERGRPYWKDDFVVDIVDKTAEAQTQLDAQEISRQAREADMAARQTLIENIKTLAQKKNRTLVDVNDLLDQVCALLIKI